MLYIFRLWRLFLLLTLFFIFITLFSFIRKAPQVLLSDKHHRHNDYSDAINDIQNANGHLNRKFDPNRQGIPVEFSKKYHANNHENVNNHGDYRDHVLQGKVGNLGNSNKGNTSHNGKPNEDGSYPRKEYKNKLGKLKDHDSIVFGIQSISNNLNLSINENYSKNRYGDPNDHGFLNLKNDLNGHKSTKYNVNNNIRDSKGKNHGELSGHGDQKRKVNYKRNDNQDDLINNGNKMDHGVPNEHSDSNNYDRQSKYGKENNNLGDGNIHKTVSIYDKEKSPLIPHIIHQTWDSYRIPRSFAEWISSWPKHHPDWEYWFWTPEDVKYLIKKKYPQLITEYLRFHQDILRANLMRYLVMYEFGGVYADLDLESLQPFDPWTFNHSCILPVNNYVHSHIVRDDNKKEVMITLLACRPGHPYFAEAIKELPSYENLKYEQQTKWPDKMYQHYLNTSISKLPANHITLGEPKYFLPTFDKGCSSALKLKCKAKNLKSLQKEVCQKLIKEHFTNQPYKESFTTHYWFHVLMRSPEWKKLDLVSIFDLVPKAKNVTKILEKYV